MKKVLVTGASGFLGRHLLEELHHSDRSATLRILWRGVRDAPPSGVEVVRGDICDRTAVREAMRDVARVYHLAGFVSRNPSQAAVLYRTHVDGTRNVCEAALEFSVEKVVLLSSSGTIAASRTPIVHREDESYANEVVGRWPYYLSKIFQEKLALHYQRVRGLPLVVVNPSLLLGPGDSRRGATRDVRLFLLRKVRALPPGGLNFVDVRDAAAVLVAAMEKGRVGERYFVGGPNWPFLEFFARLEALSGVRAPRVKLSATSAAWAARLAPILHRVAPRRFPVTQADLEMASHFWYLDNSKAREALDFSPRDPDDTLRAAIEEARRFIS